MLVMGNADVSATAATIAAVSAVAVAVACSAAATMYVLSQLHAFTSGNPPPRSWRSYCSRKFQFKL
jgi:hypothetical protein